MLRSDLCDESDAYIFVNGSVTGNKQVPFSLYITKINNTFTENAENLDIVTPM